MKKYFFFDIDGTLLAWKGETSTYIPESTLIALERLKQNGHFVAIATGRSFCMARETMERFGIRNMVHDGGYGITIDGVNIETRSLDKQLCCELADECERLGFPWGLSAEDGPFRLVPDETFQERTQDIYLESRIVKGLHPRDYDNIYKMYVACRHREEEAIQTLKKLPWCRYHERYLFVEPTDKSTGIIRMMDIMNAPVEDVVVFGDDYNDRSMFTDRWFCIAMGNAKPELKEMADYVTDDVNKDGVYKALEHFGWI